MGVITFTQKDTSELAVKTFLNSSMDYNPIHWDNDVLPGMYALHLLQPQIKRPISRVNIAFKGMSLFPENLEAELIEEETRTHFTVIRRGETIYEGDFHHNYNSQASPNNILLRPVFRIGGKLQQEFKDKLNGEMAGVYGYQSMDFSPEVTELEGPYFSDARELPGLNEKTKTYRVLTLCKAKNQTNGARGEAVVNVVPKRLINMLVEREKRKRAKA